MLMPALMLAAAAASPACIVEDARYALRGDPATSARFRPIRKNSDWPVGLVLEIHTGKTGRSFWMLPWNGGTNGRSNLRWVQPPRGGTRTPQHLVSGDLEFYSTDVTYAFLGEVPRRGSPAPARIFIPGLSRDLWMAGLEPRDNIPTAFFDLVQCAPAASGPEPDIELPRVP